jgi:hypothetical protein
MLEAPEYPPATKEWAAPPYRWPENASTAVVATSILLQGGALRLYGFTATNTKSSAQFILAFDVRDLPSNNAVPLFSLPVAATSATAAYFGSVGRSFDFGICLVNSSTSDKLTIGSADCLFDVQYVY